MFNHSLLRYSNPQIVWSVANVQLESTKALFDLQVAATH